MGEFDEERWSALRTEILESLVKIREALKATDDEIASIGEVMSSVESLEAEAAAPAALPPEAPAEAEAPAAEEPAAAGVAEEAQPESTQTDAFDELEFLRSVTDDEASKSRPGRLSGRQPRISTSDLASPIESTPLPGGGPKPPGERQSQVGAEGVESVEAREDRPAKGAAKTVKCGECGAPNLPTEWYCERCGAELAAL